MGWLRTMAAFAGLLVALSASRSASAQALASSALPLELEWEAPAGCASATRVREELARIVRVRPGRSLPNVRADARVLGGPARYHVVLVIARDGETIRRRFESEDCDALLRAATLSIALAFGDGAELLDDVPASSESEPARPAERTPVAAPVSRVRPPFTIVARGPSEGASRDAPVLALAAGGAWSPTWLSGAAYGGQILASLRASRFTLSSVNRVWLPNTIAGPGRASGRFWAATSTLAPGLRVDAGALEVELWLGLQAGVLHAAGAGVRAPSEATAPWYAAVSGMTLGVELSRGLRLTVSQEVALGLARPRFEIAPFGEIYRAPSLTPVTSLSVPLDVASF